MINKNDKIYSKVIKGIYVKHSLSVGIDTTSTQQLNIAIIGDIPPIVELSQFINDKLGIPYIKEVGGYGLPSNHAKDDNHNFSQFIEIEQFGRASRAYDTMIIIEYNKKTNEIHLLEQGEVPIDEKWTADGFHRFMKKKKTEEAKGNHETSSEEILRLIASMDPEVRKSTIAGLV